MNLEAVKQTPLCGVSDLNCNKVDYYLTNGSAFLSARSYDNERSVSQLRDCTVKNELTQAAASGVQQTAPSP